MLIAYLVVNGPQLVEDYKYEEARIEASYVRKDEFEQIVILADSIVGNFRDDTGIAAILQSELEVPVYNCGIGGMPGAKGNSDTVCQGLYDFVRTKTDEDYRYYVQVNESIASVNTSYFHEGFEAWRSIDLSIPTLVIIEYGANDYFNDFTIGEPAGEDVSTYTGSLVLGINELKEINPDFSIILVTPTYNEYPLDRELIHSIGEYAYGMEKVGEYCDVPVINTYNANIVTPENVNEITIDGIHLNEEGRQQLADLILSYIYY